MQWARFRNGEAHFRAIIDGMPDAFAAVDLQGIVVAFNRGAEKLFGVPAAAMLGHPIAGSRLPESLCQRFAGALRKACAGQPLAESFEIEGLRAGREAWVAEVSLFATGSGKDTVLAARLHDITGRRQDEEKTLRLNRILRTMAEGNQALVRATSEDELFQDMCRVIAGTGGYRMAWIGQVEHDAEKSIRPLAHAGYEAGYLALAKISWGDNPYGRGPSGMSIQTGTPQFNNDITDNPVMGPWREPALERGYLSSISLPLRDKAGVFGALTIYAGKPNAFGPEEVALLVELAGDVSYGVTALRTRRDHDEMARLIIERKKAEAALRDSEERLRLALDAGSMAAWDWHIPTDTVRWNGEHYRMLGYKPEDVKASYEAWARRVLPEDLPGTEALLMRSLEQGGDYRAEFRVLGPEDQRRWLEARGRFERDSEGRAVRSYGVMQDITERKLAEAALRASEEQLRALGDSLPGSAVYRYAHKPDGTPCFHYFSAGIEQMNGVRVEDVLRDASVLHRQILPEFLPALGEAERRSARDMSDFKMEVPMRRPDGEVRWMRLQSRPRRTQDGGIMWDGVQTDITERKQAEDQLRRSETLLKSATDNAGVGLVLLDRNRRYLFANRAYSAILGLGSGDIVGKGPAEVLPALYPDQISPRLDRAFAGERLTYELVKADAAGEPRYFTVVYDPLRDGGGEVVNVIVVIYDITAPKLAELRIAASEEKFRGIYQHAGTGIAILDLKGRFQSCNPAFSAMLGYTEDELLGLNFQDLVHPDDIETNMAFNGRLLAGEIPSFEIVNRYIAKGGKPIWVHKHISSLRDATGRPIQIIALTTDITERKLHEERIDLLMHEVNHRAKNMLAVVLAVARQTIATQPEDFIARFAQRIQAMAASQDLLVKNEWQGVPIGELVRSQLAHFNDLIGTRIALDGPSLFISTSAAQTLGMALHELATNAGKYGALSNGDGRLQVRWGLECTEGGEETFTMSWRESGGPPVTAPEKRGFGSTEICRMAIESLDAKVDLDFAPAGLCWRLECPSKEVIGLGL